MVPAWLIDVHVLYAEGLAGSWAARLGARVKRLCRAGTWHAPTHSFCGCLFALDTSRCLASLVLATLSVHLPKQCAAVLHAYNTRCVKVAPQLPRMVYLPAGWLTPGPTTPADLGLHICCRPFPGHGDHCCWHGPCAQLEEKRACTQQQAASWRQCGCHDQCSQRQEGS